MIGLQRQIGVAKRPKKTKRIPEPLQPRTIEREYARMILSIVREVELALKPLIEEMPSLIKSAENEWQRLDGTTIYGANWKTQIRLDAGEGKRIKELQERARQELRSKLNDTHLESFVEKFGKRSTDLQKDQLKKQVRSAMGIDILSTDRKLAGLMETWVAENVGLIKSIPEKLISGVGNTITRAVQKGAKPRDVAKELVKQFGIEKDRAAIIARDQIGTIYGQVNAQRQRELGVARFVWRTVGDEAVRPEHEDRDGETYSYDDPPDGELPGEPINCRCWAEPVFDEILNGVVEE